MAAELPLTLVVRTAAESTSAALPLVLVMAAAATRVLL